jgi:hypothetical protein
VFTPEKLITVIEETTLCDRVAVTVALLSTDGANALQISEVPSLPLARTTTVQLRPPPLTPVTVVFVPPLESVAINANSSSLPAVVANAGLLMFALATFASLLVFASVLMGVVFEGLAVTDSVSEAMAVAAVESVTVTICVNVPACVGTPESTPEALNVRPSTPVPDHV